MQVVILAGGLATRLRPLTQDVPKTMVPIQGRPFLEYQLSLLRKAGMTRILLLVGHLGQMIESHFEDGSKFGVELSYNWEQGELLGTGGALRNARASLDDEFLLMYGDSYLMLDYSDAVREFRHSKMPGMMVVFRNEDKWDRSNMVVRDGKIVFYSKTERWPDTYYIDAGVSLYRRSVLDLLPAEGAARLETVTEALVAQKKLHAYETSQRFYEIGSFAGLEEFQALGVSP